MQETEIPLNSDVNTLSIENYNIEVEDRDRRESRRVPILENIPNIFDIFTVSSCREMNVHVSYGINGIRVMVGTV